MTSHLYSKPTRSRTQKLVLVLLAVILLLIASLVFVWLKPGGNTDGAAAPLTSDTGAPSAVVTSGSTGPVPSSTGAAPASGPAQWGVPVPGDGGPSTKTALGVPRGYDASDSGASKAAVNGVVAARWMKFRIEDPANTLVELVIPEGSDDRTQILSQLVPASPINVDTGKREVEETPAGGKVLGSHLVRRDAATAVVKVLWEQFAQPEKGQLVISLEPIEVRLTRVQDDWLISGMDRTSIDDSKPTSAIVGVVGRVAEWVPVPSEGWYW